MEANTEARSHKANPVREDTEQTNGELRASDADSRANTSGLSDNRGEPSGAFNSAGFQRTRTKPAIFFKILTDDDIEKREEERKKKRERILHEIVTLEAARVEDEWRRLRRKQVELRERRMREVIFSELNKIWLSGRDLQHPDQVDPYIRGDGGEVSEERSLRKRLFYGCFREFVNKSRVKGHPYAKPGFASAPHLRYHKHHQPADSHSGGSTSYAYSGQDERRSVLDTVTWTAEEVRIYYECMIKHNVWPVRYPTGSHALGVSANLPQQFDRQVSPQSGFVAGSFHRASKSVTDAKYFPDDGHRAFESDNAMKPLRVRRYFGPNLRHNFMPSPTSHRTLTKPSTVILKAATPALSKVLIGKNLTKVSSDKSESVGSLKSAFFVDELLKENVDHDAVCHVIDENDDVDLYDDL